MITVGHRIGKLVGIRYASPVAPAEIDAFELDLRKAIGSLPMTVFVVDFSALVIMDGELAERTTKIMKSDNPKVLKSAFLLPTSAVGALQTERMIREAVNPRRRAFRDVGALLEWIHPDLDEAERSSSRAFFQAV